MDPTVENDELPNVEGMDNFISEITNAIPGIDEAMSFAEMLKWVLVTEFWTDHLWIHECNLFVNLFVKFYLNIYKEVLRNRTFYAVVCMCVFSRYKFWTYQAILLRH